MHATLSFTGASSQQVRNVGYLVAGQIELDHSRRGCLRRLGHADLARCREVESPGKTSRKNVLRGDARLGELFDTGSGLRG